MLGEVGRPNSVVMPRGRFSLAEALSDSGGVNPFSGNAGQIYVIRDGGAKPQIYHLDAASPAALLLAEQFDMRARDVVYVDAVGVVRWARVINNILPTAEFLRLSIRNLLPEPATMKMNIPRHEVAPLQVLSPLSMLPPPPRTRVRHDGASRAPRRCCRWPTTCCSTCACSPACGWRCWCWGCCTCCWRSRCIAPTRWCRSTTAPRAIWRPISRSIR